MVLACADDLYVREADAARVVAHKQFIGAGVYEGHLEHGPVLAEILEACAVKWPQAIAFGQRLCAAAVFIENVSCHGFPLLCEQSASRSGGLSRRS